MISMEAKIEAYYNFVCKYYNLSNDIVKKNVIISHIKKADKIILLALYSYILILNIFTYIFFFKSFSKISYLNQKKIYKFFSIFNFIVSKIDDFLLIIISFHQYGSEKIEKLNLNEKVTEENENFKFVVIGSGPSGSVVSNELNKNFNGEVLVIEKGDYYDLPSTKHPGDEFKKKWYRGGLNSTYFPEMVAYSSGSCMGGGSEINS